MSDELTPRALRQLQDLRKRGPVIRREDDDDDPDGRRLTRQQAVYLSGRTGMSLEDLRRSTVGEVHERLRWHLDPILLTHVRICGRVVYTDPTTGESYPVPFADVHVYDTDCNLLGYAPAGHRWLWFHRWGCHRERITTVRTDACGNFCVWIPRWDVDRILRWRRERICIPLLERPRIRDILEGLIPREPFPPIPGPRPDPVPDFAEPALQQEVQTRLGVEMADRLARLTPPRRFGASRAAFDAALDAPAPRSLLPVPPPPEPKGMPRDGLGEKTLAEIDLRRPLGPFVRCHDVFIPEWTTILDVPDITFGVTQEQGGSDVTIYDESLFDVRWNAGSMSDVVLEAGPQANWVEVCGDSPDVACEDQPAILHVDLMPLTSAYHDDSAGDATFGYGIRVNQPSPDGVNDPSPGPLAGTAQAPYADRLDLYGCVRIDGRTHYRVVYSFEGGAPQPVTGVSFAVLTSSFTVDHQVPDVDGWYPIRSDLIGASENLILPWPTQQSRFADGTYEVAVEVATASGSGYSNELTGDAVTFEVDNSRPSIDLQQIRWWYDGPGTPSPQILDDICPVLARNPTRDVIVEVTWSASAQHLRSAVAGMGGCGGGNPEPLPASGPHPSRSWYWQSFGDTATGTRVARWRLKARGTPGGHPAGCYGVTLTAVSRAYNPAVPGSSTTDDWWVDEVRRRTRVSRAISVVDV